MVWTVKASGVRLVTVAMLLLVTLGPAATEATGIGVGAIGWAAGVAWVIGATGGKVSVTMGVAWDWVVPGPDRATRKINNNEATPKAATRATAITDENPRFMDSD